jgi:hypothetical protein
MKLLCLLGLGVYATLSVMDYRLTYTLVEGTGGAVFEGNPIAASWLELYGWRGLALFKVGMVVLFVGMCLFIAARRPRTAAVVIAMGCAALLVVTNYSRRLIDEHRTNYPEIDLVSVDELADADAGPSRSVLLFQPDR